MILYPYEKRCVARLHGRRTFLYYKFKKEGNNMEVKIPKEIRSHKESEAIPNFV